MEIHELSALELRQALADGEVSSVEAVQALLARADALNGRINALVHRFDEQALAEARKADEKRSRGFELGPLEGLPITIKESIATAGLPSTLGLARRRSQVQVEDAVTVQLLRRAGAIVLGKTNVAQLLLSHESENPLWGAARNPWDLGRTPGGSSGGEAAAIAAGLTPWGVGTDIGGSIRVPAAFSGIVGLKPTVDRWSNVRSFTALMGQEIVRGQCGPMARTVADAAYLLRAIDSPLHAPLDPAVPPLPTGDPAEVDLRGLTVGVYETDGFIRPAASVRRAVREAAAWLEAAGARVVAFDPPDQELLVETYYAALSSDGGAVALEAGRGEEAVPQLSELMRTVKLPDPVRRLAAAIMERRGEKRVALVLRALGRKPVEEYWALAARRTQIRLDVCRAWHEAGIDAVIGPPHATPAIPHRQSADFTAAGSYGMRYNFLNFPAGVVPVTRVRPEEAHREPAPGEGIDRLERKAALIEAGSTGLPVGVQVAARPWREDLVLAVMAAVEAGARAAGEHPRTPVTP